MNKVTTLPAAIATHVQPGSSLYLAGFSHLIAFAAAHEIIRQRIEDLTLIRLSPDLPYDQMVKAGCASKLLFAYIGNPSVGSLKAIRQAIADGLDYEEYSHGSLIAALRAGAANQPFVAVDALGASDLARANPLVRMVRSPYEDRDVAVLPPLRPDVTIVHAQRADAFGNCQIWGAPGDIAEAAYAAGTVIVTAEEIVDEEVLRRDPNRVLLLGLGVSAVVHVPWGAHPSYAQGFYARDNRFYRRWGTFDEDDIARYLDEYVYGVEDRESYVTKLRPRLNELAAVGDGWSGEVNYGDNAAQAAVQD